MADSLIIRLAREPERDATWTVVDEAGRIVIAPQSGALSDAAMLAAGRRICALVPGADVLITEAEVPLRGAKLQQVVPFALEEQLAEDIEALHFALGKRAASSGRVPVAVVSRALLDRWLAELRAAGLSAEAVYADSELVPANPGQVVALLEGDEIVLRMPDGAPVAIPADTLSSALEVAGGPGDTPARGLLVYAPPFDWDRYAPQIELLRERFDGIKVQLLASGALALFAQRLHAADAINLLQGGYAPTSSMKEGWRAWRVAAILAGCLLALHVAGKAVELGVLHRAEGRADASIEETFRAAMPGEQNSADAKRLMQQKLAAARGGGTSSGLLPALAALAQARAAVPGTTLSSLSYREGTLDLRMSAPNAESLDRLSQVLRSQGWQADLTSGSASEGGYQGQLQLRAGGPS